MPAIPSDDQLGGLKKKKDKEQIAQLIKNEELTNLRNSNP